MKGVQVAVQSYCYQYAKSKREAILKSGVEHSAEYWAVQVNLSTIFDEISHVNMLLDKNTDECQIAHLLERKNQLQGLLK
jgi:hypothetical protein